MLPGAQLEIDARPMVVSRRRARYRRKADLTWAQFEQKVRRAGFRLTDSGIEIFGIGVVPFRYKLVGSGRQEVDRRESLAAALQKCDVLASR